MLQSECELVAVMVWVIVLCCIAGCCGAGVFGIYTMGKNNANQNTDVQPIQGGGAGQVCAVLLCTCCACVHAHTCAVVVCVCACGCVCMCVCVCVCQCVFVCVCVYGGGGFALHTTMNPAIGHKAGSARCPNDQCLNKPIMVRPRTWVAWGGVEGVGRVRPSVMLPPTPMHPPP